MSDNKDLTPLLDNPPPGVTIHTRDWEQTLSTVRLEIWALWSYLGTQKDGTTFRIELQNILLRRDIKQKQLAEIIGFSRTVVSRWFQGRRLYITERRIHIPAELSTVQQIADELDCSQIERYSLIRAYAIEVLWLKGFFKE